MKSLPTPFILLLALSSFAHAKTESTDSTPKFPKPIVEKIEGWTIELDPALKAPDQRKFLLDVKKAMANHLQRIVYILPPEKTKALRKLPIRIDLEHKLTNMQYHPAKQWLIANGHDPSLEKRVHVPRARNLLSRGTWAKHPYVILHELAHAYHDQVLGFGNPEVLKAYNRSEKEGLYERVLLFRGGKTRHYARTNHKEFFAEMTESYLGVNDFYPFVRAELKEHDPETFALMAKIWGKI
jgi:hypothetical protein